MAFPFLPGGAVVAAAVLLSAIAGFVAGMMAIDRTATRVFGGVVSGVVSGARRWRDGAPTYVRTRSDELQPLDTARIDSLGDRAEARTSAVGDDVRDPSSTLLTDEAVEPVEPLDRVRPRVR
jgi:hypothetical protein